MQWLVFSSLVDSMDLDICYCSSDFHPEASWLIYAEFTLTQSIWLAD